jgi:hypothetical protein
VKIVNSDGFWGWTRSDKGTRGHFLKNPPVHAYQTVMRFWSENPPRGHDSTGYFLGGPLFFDIDLIGKDEPFTLWRLIDSSYSISELIETLSDRGDYHIVSVIFSGFRGVHIVVERENKKATRIPLGLNYKTRKLLADVRSERKQVARSIGKWCSGWDWKVSADIWRVSRVPFSIHGESALSAIILKPPFSAKSIRNQLKNASPFSLTKNLHVRMKKAVPHFTFIDGETYGPFRKGWSTKLPIAVALHLIWQDYAKPRESGPKNIGEWFSRGWRNFFREDVAGSSMDKIPAGGAGG